MKSLAVESQEITEQIRDAFGTKIISSNLAQSQQSVCQWGESRQNIFIRLHDLLQDVSNQNAYGEELAIRAARVMLRHIGGGRGYMPVPVPERRFSALTLLEATVGPLQETASIQGLLSDYLKNGTLSSDELDRLNKESEDLIQAALHVQGQIQRLQREAQKNGGRVELSEKEFAGVRS